MMKLSGKILEVLEVATKEEVLSSLAEVVSEYGLDVAANLIREDCEPSYFLKNGFEEHQYGEGKTDSGHLPLSNVLKEVEKVINCDMSEKAVFSFDKNFVRLQNQQEILENGLGDSDIAWYTDDEKEKVEEKKIGFNL